MNKKTEKSVNNNFGLLTNKIKQFLNAFDQEISFSSLIIGEEDNDKNFSLIVFSVISNNPLTILKEIG